MSNERQRVRFGVTQRADGLWEIVDRQTGLVGVRGVAMPVQRAAWGYAAWLNREDRSGTLGADYHSTRPRPDPQLPEEASGNRIDRLWRWRSLHRRTSRRDRRSTDTRQDAPGRP